MARSLPRTALVALVLLAGSLSVACESPLRPLASTVCHETRAASSGGESVPIVEPTDAEWVALLTDDEEGASSSCERVLARTPPSIPRCEGQAVLPAPVLGAIAPRIVARLHREGDDDLIWVATHTTSDGAHAGPLAVIHRTALGLEVQALGTHLGPSDHAELRLLRTATAAVIAVEADRGEERVAHLLIQSGGALVPAALEVPSREHCQAPASIVLRQVDETRRRDGWTRRAVRTAMLAEHEAGLIVREHLTVRELDPEDPDAPPRATHDADAIRTLRPVGSRLRADREALMAPAEPSPAAERGARATRRESATTRGPGR